MEQKIYDEQLIIAALLASAKKIKAGLHYAASGKYQNYPEGTIEVGVVLDAIDMLVKDVSRCIAGNADE